MASMGLPLALVLLLLLVAEGAEAAVYRFLVLSFSR